MPDPVADATTPAPDGFNANPAPNQEQGKGNPEPPAPKAKAPVKEPEKKDEQKPADKPAEEKPADKPADKPDPDAPLDTNVWGDAGNENANAVLTVLQNSGISTKEAQELIGGAFLAGNVTAIDRAALEAKVGKAAAAVVLIGVKNEIKARQDGIAAIVSDLHTEVGGKDNWKKVADWASENVPDDDLKELRGMIDAGGRQAKLAARELKTLYEKADGNTSLQHAETLPGNTPPTPTSEPLSGPQYVRKVEELNKKFFGKPPEHMRKALLAARQAGRQAGL